jgi:hypothetical protein
MRASAPAWLLTQQRWQGDGRADAASSALLQNFLSAHLCAALHSNIAWCSEKKHCRNKGQLFFAKNPEKIFFMHNRGDNF